jgi:hypothetical protein
LDEKMIGIQAFRKKEVWLLYIMLNWTEVICSDGIYTDHWRC